MTGLDLDSSFLRRLAEGFAALLSAADAGFAFPDADGAIPFRVLELPETPDVLCSITPKPMKASPSMRDSMFALQLTFRVNPWDSTTSTGGPPALFAMSGACKQQIAGRYPATLPTGVQVETLQYLSGGSLGADDSYRLLWADNYQLMAYEPTPYRH